MSPKFAEACEKLEVAVSQRLPLSNDTATAALLDAGYQRSEHEEDDAPTEHESDCGSTELDEDVDGTSEAEIAPTQLDVDVTQVTPEQVRTSDAWSPLKPAQLFAEASVAGEDAGGIVTTDATDRRKGGDGAAKGFYSEPEDVAPRKAEMVLEQAATWEYWQPPPPFQEKM